MKNKESKFIQITGAGAHLYALDESGRVWVLSYDSKSEDYEWLLCVDKRVTK